MTKFDIPKLKMPPYEWLKSLPKDKGHFITLFDTPTSVYGRITLYEDGFKVIHFDVMECGYCDKNHLGLSLKFNKKNYAKICRHAQEVYANFFFALRCDMSYKWEAQE